MQPRCLSVGREIACPQGNGQFDQDVFFARRYQSFFNTTSDAIAVVNPMGDILDANPRLLDWVSLPYTDAVSRNLLKFFGPEDAGFLEERIHRLLEDGRGLSRVECVMRPGFGTALRCEITLQLLRQQYGYDRSVMVVLKALEASPGGLGLSGFSGISPTEREVRGSSGTERPDLKRFMLMTSGLAHNLKTPLSGIKGCTQLMKMDYDIQELDLIIHEIEVMESIIHCMMSKSRKDHEPKEEVIDLNELIETELLFLQADMAFKYEVTKRIHLDETIPSVRGVYSHFSQVLMNIIQNALDAMDGRDMKVLTVRTRGDEEAVYIDVEDSGCGIPADIRDRVFDDYFTTKEDRPDAADGRPSGTGLGLGSALSLIRAYDGDIQMESRPEEGTKVTIRIPCR